MSPLLTVKEAAEQLRVHELTIRRYIREGKLRSVRVGGRVRLPQDEIERFIGPSDWTTGALTLEGAMALISKPIGVGELQRRRGVFEEIRALGDKIGYLGISAEELIREGRAERERRTGAT